MEDTDTVNDAPETSPAPTAAGPHDDPTVAVTHPTIDDYSGKPVVVGSLLHVTCTEHGEITDWAETGDDERRLAQEAAKAHAIEAHDGLVNAEGWAR